MNLPEAPENVLDPKHPWYKGRVPNSSWEILKSSLTGKEDSYGIQRVSYVKLSDSEADRLIENLKKDPRGFPQFNTTGGLEFFINQQKYQEWLVKNYLKTPKIEEKTTSVNVSSSEKKQEPEVPAEQPEEEPEVLSEEIDEVILRLLNLKDKQKIDYKTYYSIIVKKLASGRLIGTELHREEDELLRDELKRVKKIKDNGSILEIREKKTKVETSSDSQSTPSTSVEDAPDGAIVKYQKGEITPTDITPKDSEENQKEEKSNDFLQIQKTLESILKLLKSKFDLNQKKQNQERKEEETKRRKKKESSLEGITKAVSGVVDTAKKVLSPFQSLIDKIKRFIFFTLLGAAFNKFMNWLKDKENREKFNAFIDFITDHFPAIAGLYILFGTSFGKLIRGLLKLATKMIFALIASSGKIAGFLKKNKMHANMAKLALAALPIASGAIADIFKDKDTPDSSGIPSSDSDFDDVKESTEKAKETQVPKFNQGGIVEKIPSFNLGGMIPQIPTFKLGGSVPSFDGMGMNSFQEGIPITGAGSDNTLIAAKTGEAILTDGDQRDLNNRFIDRETGRPLNIPSYLSGRTPGKVSMSKIGFPGGGVFDGFANGGVIEKFNMGGIVGGNYNSNFGMEEPMRFNPIALSGSFNDPMDSNGHGHKNKTQNSGSVLFSNALNRYNQGGLVSNTLNRYNQGGLMERVQKFGSGIVSGASQVVNKILNFNSGNNSKPNSTTTPQPTKIPLPEHRNPEVISLLKTIRFAEHYRGANPYIALYGGKTAPITKMTIQEAIEMGNTRMLPLRFGGKSAGYKSGSSATGAYQFMPFTLEDLIRKGVAKPNEVMTPDVQDRLGWQLVKGRKVTLNYLKQHGLNQVVMDKLAPEWASFPYSGAGGKSYYGQPVKSADALIKIYSQALPPTQPKVQGKIGGGKITSKTGTSISGATNDTQLARLHIGEYVLPKKTVQKIGIPAIEYMVAMTDSNSEAYLKRGSIHAPQITPYETAMNDEPIMLPPIYSGAGSGKGSGSLVGSDVPSTSAVSPINDRDLIAKSYYGIV